MYFLLIVPDKVPSSEFKEYFFYPTSLPTDEISWLMIMKRLFKKCFGEADLNLFMMGLGIVHDSLAIFCHTCMQQKRV